MQGTTAQRKALRARISEDLPGVRTTKAGHQGLAIDATAAAAVLSVDDPDRIAWALGQWAVAVAAPLEIQTVTVSGTAADAVTDVVDAPADAAAGQRASRNVGSSTWSRTSGAWATTAPVATGSTGDGPVILITFG